MTNLDLLSAALAHATGKPVTMWRRQIQRAFRHDPEVRKRLRCVAPNGQAKLEALKAEGPGILNWLVEGRLMAHTIGDKIGYDRTN